MKPKKKMGVFALVLASMLTACGGGGGSDPGANPTTSLSGTVAIGAPLAGATVIVKDGSGNSKTTTTDATGNYKISDASTLSAPLMLQAKGIVNGGEVTLHSVLDTKPALDSILNATPATEAVTAHALGSDPASVFQDQSQIRSINTTDLKAAKSKLTEAIALVLSALGQDSSKIDLFTTAFNADNTGLDKLLDFISFQGDITEMRVANKNTGESISVKKNDSTINKLPALTEAEKSLDISSIKALLTSMNSALESESKALSQMPVLISNDYLQEGDRKDAVVKLYASKLAGAQYTDFIVLGCDTTAKICNVNFAIKKANALSVVDDTAIKYEDGKWVHYGDQSTVPFDLKPVANAVYAVSNGVANNGKINTGMNLFVESTPTNRINSARLSYKINGEANWIELQRFSTSAVCGYMVAVNNSNDGCSNFFEVSDELANKLNATKYQLKVETFPSANPTGDATRSFTVSGKKLFTKATGNIAAQTSGLNILSADLGTTSVHFFGSNIEYLDIGLQNGGGTSWEEDDVLAMNNTISAPNDSAITRVLLVKRNLEGQAVWMTFYK